MKVPGKTAHFHFVNWVNILGEAGVLRTRYTCSFTVCHPLTPPILGLLTSRVNSLLCSRGLSGLPLTQLAQAKIDLQGRPTGIPFSKTQGLAALPSVPGLGTRPYLLSE